MRCQDDQDTWGNRQDVRIVRTEDKGKAKMAASRGDDVKDTGTAAVEEDTGSRANKRIKTEDGAKDETKNEAKKRPRTKSKTRGKTRPKTKARITQRTT